VNRIDKTFKVLRSKGRKAFIAYITAGDPDIKSTADIVVALEKSGVDIIELGIPFSDPIADGPTIQAASFRALQKGSSLAKVFAMVAKLRKQTQIPIAFMTYYNPVLKYGLDGFFKSCRKAGVDGVIIPDLPTEESKDILRLGRNAGVRTIFLVAPTSTRDRIAQIVKRSSGFIYYVSTTGVTGARKKLPDDITKNTRLIRSMTDKPIAVGFGVSDAAQAASVAKAADAVIVGSAIVRIIAGGRGSVKRCARFAQKIAGAVHGV
jgi:tryptophan synthase alpha chain